MSYRLAADWSSCSIISEIDGIVAAGRYVAVKCSRWWRISVEVDRVLAVDGGVRVSGRHTQDLSLSTVVLWCWMRGLSMCSLDGVEGDDIALT